MRSGVWNRSYANRLIESVDTDRPTRSVVESQSNRTPCGMHACTPTDDAPMDPGDSGCVHHIWMTKQPTHRPIRDSKADRGAGEMYSRKDCLGTHMWNHGSRYGLLGTDPGNKLSQRGGTCGSNVSSQTIPPGLSLVSRSPYTATNDLIHDRMHILSKHNEYIHI